MLRLRNVEAPLANFFASGIFNLREKLSPILWQFPPNFRYDHDRLASFFDLLPHDTKAALADNPGHHYRLRLHAPARRQEAVPERILGQVTEHVGEAYCRLALGL